MCGIAGALSWGGPPDRAAVERMIGRLAHRGPDADGLFARGPIVLGHRRLAIIDLDPASNQPLADATGRVWMVFNGEIYNFLALRARLEREGVRFRTQGDTEVMVEAYRAWGDRFVDQLNGMFAFALWDEERGRLLLARDPAGEKPLYYQLLDERDGGGIVFASELGALTEHPRVSTTVDPVAVGHFLSLGYTLGERPILEGVRRLPAAHTLVVERGRPSEPRPYWDLAPSFRDQRRFADLEEAAAALGAAIDDAVALRLVSDVPLGAFLSGGIDSSTVVEAMARTRPAPAPRTFSIGFREDSFDELPQARAVATRLGVEHEGEYVGLDAAAALRHLTASQGEPFADTSIVPFYHLARFARARVTVCLSGDGGDELLAGYPTYAADRLHRWTRWLPGWASGAAGALVAGLWPASFGKVAADYKLRQFLSGHRLDFRRAHHHWRVLFSPEQKRSLLRPAWSEAAAADGFEHFDRHFDAVEGCHYLDQAMYVDLKTWMVDDILFKVDRATMAHSLESRAPFLDRRVMELAAGVPADWKLARFRGKRVLRRAVRRRLPAEVLAQPKRGFNAPVSAWLAGELEPFAREAMRASALFDWVEPEAVERLWREHHGRAADHGYRLFALTCLALWMAHRG